MTPDDLIDINLRLDAIEKGLQKLGLRWCKNCGYVRSSMIDKNDMDLCDECLEVLI